MTTTTAGPLAGSPAATNPAFPERRGVTFGRVVAAEWVKFRSLRSSAWTLGLTAFFMGALSFAAAAGSAAMADDGVESGTLIDLLSIGFYPAQLTVAVLGVLIITGEYSTGLVRSTFAATPTRVPVLVAKAIVLSVAVAVTSVVGLALAYLATLPFHGTLGVSLDLGAPDAVRILAGTPLYLVAVALLGMGIGALLRHSAGAISAVLALMLLVETVLNVIPVTWVQTIGAFLPTTAGSRLLMSTEVLESMRGFADVPYLTPWQGYGVLVGWAVLALAVAAVLLRRRDA